MTTGKNLSFWRELLWNLKENFISKWFLSFFVFILSSSCILTFVTSLALLKAEIITTAFGLGLYFLLIGIAVAVPIIAVASISTLHAAQHLRKNNATVLGDFMGRLRLSTWLSAPFILFATGTRVALVNLSGNSAKELNLTQQNSNAKQFAKEDFTAVEITIIEVESEIKDMMSQLYEDLEKHFRHRDSELLIYQRTISELGNAVDPKIELERNLLRQEWQTIKAAIDDPDPKRFFEAVEHYLNTTTAEISDIEELLDDEYDLDKGRGSLLFKSSSLHDTEDVRSDMEIIAKNPNRDWFTHH